jgi:hypothetical protein
MALCCNDTARAAIVEDMMGDFRDLYKQGRIIGLIYFSWNSDPWSKQVSASTIYRCNALTPNGKLVLNKC